MDGWLVIHVNMNYIKGEKIAGLNVHASGKDLRVWESQRLSPKKRDVVLCIYLY